jgi:hypothetical protein
VRALPLFILSSDGQTPLVGQEAVIWIVPIGLRCIYRREARLAKRAADFTETSNETHGSQLPRFNRTERGTRNGVGGSKSRYSECDEGRYTVSGSSPAIVADGRGVGITRGGA